MIVTVFEDIPHRLTGDGTWIEAGDYTLVRELETGKLVIEVKRFNKERTVTIVRKEEIL